MILSRRNSWKGEKWRTRAPALDELMVLFAAAEVVDEHLFDWLVVGHENVADSVAADEVADFFGKIFGVVAGALEGLGHEDDLQAALAGDVFRVLDVAQEDQVAQAVHFG